MGLILNLGKCWSSTPNRVISCRGVQKCLCNFRRSGVVGLQAMQFYPDLQAQKNARQ